MKLRLSLAIVAVTLSGTLLTAGAQTPGSPDCVKFVRVDRPVPAQKIQGSNPAGEFYHATYTGAAWGDYDGDGFLDLYYSHLNTMISNTSVFSNLYHNSGDGTFSRVSFSSIAGAAYSSPVWLDVDADGKLDLFLSGIGVSSYHWNDALTNTSLIRANVYLGNGEGGFTAVDNHGIRPLFNGMTGGKAHNWAAAGDYDGDGLIDLVMQGFDDAKRMDTPHPEEAQRVVYLYRNVGNGKFELQQSPLADGGEFHGLTDGSVTFADLDGDGRLDLFTTGYGASRNAEAYIYWNNGDGTFTEGDQLPMLPLTDASSSVADLNNDGKCDLVLTGVYSDTGRKHFFICRNDGDREFSLIDIENLEGVDGGQLAFGDVNHDGLTDMLMGGHGATHEHMTCLYINQGNFNFSIVGAYYDDPFGKKGSFSRVTHGSHHLVDVDRDGFLDAWFNGWSNGSCSNGCATELWHNNSDTMGVTANHAPIAPTGLNARVQDGDIVFEWTAGADDVTPAEALRYNIFVREKGASETYMIIPADIVTGTLKVSVLTGALNTCSYRMKLPVDKNYVWGVQTIDNGNLASNFALAEMNNGVSAINDVKTLGDKVTITGARGGFHYRLNAQSTVTVYSPSGVMLTRANLNGSGFMPVNTTGVAVVQVENSSLNRSFKVVF